mmetsp:Transcript_20617/g.38459  ORF Transcript_20617/g.38459 Transcript_20617/m.38459 type:complete len:338 (-) Transcript_20617:20-1033(-)
MMGDEIARIINEQRRLENHYSHLVDVRGKLIGISNKQKYAEVKQEIKEVAHALKENTKNLTRVLKDNPNIQDNLRKIKQDRASLADMLRHCDSELQDNIYISFEERVSEELERQDLLSKKKAIEKETTQNAKQLQAYYKKEKEESKKETKDIQEEIQRLKDDLQEAKSEQAIKLKYEEKEFRATEEQSMREMNSKLREEEEKIATLIKKIEVEEKACKRTEEFLNSIAEKITDDAAKWDQRKKNEFDEIDAKITLLNDKRTRAKQRLKELDEYVAHQEMAQRTHEEEESRLAEEKRLKRAAEQRKLDAMETIWDILRDYKEMPKKAPRKRGGKKKKK